MKLLPVLPLAVSAATLLFSVPAQADLKLPAIFSNHMVLQRDVPVSVWGWGEQGEVVKVSIAGQTHETKTEEDGTWLVTLDPLATAEGLTMTVEGKNKLTVEDVLVGEVWLGSGQSNMEMAVNRTLNFPEEQAAANFPKIRMFTVVRKASLESLDDCKGEWKICSPETVGGFSATAYYFGREIHQKLKQPVGLVHSSWGGTDIAAWTSVEANGKSLEMKAFVEKWEKDDEAFDPKAAKAENDKAMTKWKTAVAKAKADGAKDPNRPRLKIKPSEDPNYPSNLFNGMIYPIAPYTIRGVLWYQGEHNSYDLVLAERYRRQLPLLIKDWRETWELPQLPFGYVQLPNFARPGEGRPLVREAMLQTLDVPYTGMAVTVDIGESNDNHPRNKQEVGRRLSLWALAKVYHQKDVAYTGPVIAGHEVRDGKVTLLFKHTDGGLKPKDGGELKGFLIAGSDRQWKPAQTKIEGDKIVVTSAEVPQPVAVRYAWEPDPICNLTNGSGLPASPFRTDDWAPVPTPAQVAKAPVAETPPSAQ